MKHAVATEHVLDVIDEVRGSLGGGLQGSQQAFYEELLASLPQFVAVGPQSAGKRAPPELRAKPLTLLTVFQPSFSSCEMDSEL